MIIKPIIRRMTILALLIFIGSLSLMPAQAGVGPIPGFFIRDNRRLPRLSGG
ncbi:MAG: hypothetical protein Q9P01_17720 [Anaerolineae bacterium]|nr:hypothetical protein [Anaerolineae bacterium]